MSDGELVALTTGISLVLVALITGVPSWIAAINARRTHAAVGRPNGNGNLVEMGEKTLGNTTESLGWQSLHEETDLRRFGIADQRFAAIEEHLGIERGEAFDAQ